MRSVAPVAGLFLCACASSTGILPAGPDTYTLTERLAPIRGGGNAAEANALAKPINFALIKAVNLLQP